MKSDKVLIIVVGGVIVLVGGTVIYLHYKNQNDLKAQGSGTSNIAGTTGVNTADPKIQVQNEINRILSGVDGWAQANNNGNWTTTDQAMKSVYTSATGNTGNNSNLWQYTDFQYPNINNYLHSSGSSPSSAPTTTPGSSSSGKATMTAAQVQAMMNNYTQQNGLSGTSGDSIDWGQLASDVGSVAAIAAML